MRSYVAGLVSGVLVIGLLVVGGVAGAKNRGMFLGTGPTPYYANIILPLGSKTTHQFVGDGTVTNIQVHSIRAVRCVFWEWRQSKTNTTKFDRVEISSQEGDACTGSFTSMGSYYLDLTCLGTTPKGPTAECITEIKTN